MTSFASLKREIRVLQQGLTSSDDWQEKERMEGLTFLIEGLVKLSRNELSEQDLNDLAAFSTEYNLKHHNRFIVFKSAKMEQTTP